MIPQQLQKKDFRFCLLKKKDKIPFEKNWQNNGYVFDDPKLLQHINKGGNYGIIGGYGNLRIIDCDKKEFAEEINKVFNTFKVRSGSGGIHIYILSDYDINHVFTEGRGELRARNYQCVGPGSQHPNGEFYEIVQDTGIIEISKNGMELILSPYLKKSGVESSLNEVKTEDSDKSRSGREWAEVCRLIDLNYTKEQIYEKMTAFSKWSASPEQYREMTYAKALKQKKVNELINNGHKFDEASSIFKRLRQATEFIKIQPLFYDESKNWWIWDFNKPGWKQTDETNILNAVSKALGLNTTSSKTRIEILNGLQQVGRQNMPQEIKSTWVQFKGKIKDIESGEEFDASPKYFVTNPINWKMGDSEETPHIDDLFESWVGEEHKQELYEAISFCIIPEYFIHRIIVLIGAGANGKGTFLKIILKLIGRSNIISTNLDRIMKGRFETSKLYKKLVCVMGETNFSTIQKTEVIKGLTGQDLTPGENKGKNPFDFENFAKIIIATNSLPMTTDKTTGFYRRWKIIDFKKEFSKEKDVLSEIPETEYENLAFKCFNIAKRLWKDRVFTNDGTFEDRKRRYEEKSNPIMLFIQKFYKKDINSDVVFGDFFDELEDFLAENKYRQLTNKTVSAHLKDNGFIIKQSTKDGKTATRIMGLYRKNGQNTSNTQNTLISTPNLHVGNGVKMPVFNVFGVFEPKDTPSFPVEIKVEKTKIIDGMTVTEEVYDFIKNNPESSFLMVYTNLKIDEEKLDNILKKMKNEGLIFEPKVDKYMVV